jgi:hypothetical protein
MTPIRKRYLVIRSRSWVEATREGKYIIVLLQDLIFQASCLAVMFAKLGMSVKDAFEEFNKISNEVYLVDMKPERRTARLRECVEDLLKKRGLPIDLKMGKDKRGPQSKCSWYVLNIVNCF